MSNLFSAFELQVDGASIPAYLIESTAPDNIDDRPLPLEAPPGTVSIEADAAIDKVVDHLSKAERPNLVVTVHGFNCPRGAVLENFWNAFQSVNRDEAIARSDVVCIGYRWPSERIFSPIGTAIGAAPKFLIGALVAGIAGLFAAPFLQHFGMVGPWLNSVISILATLAVSISITLLLLRIVVYFRDGYRATTFGVPDLVEIIRQIDDRLGKIDHRGNIVELSFIGHSMGAYLVTGTVRILSDVFSPASIQPSLNTGVATAERPVERLSPEIGKVFRLMRLVLVSPDIPAEALISNRANFLASSLRRFEEAYLFSNEGDEVLRQISTTANYFSFPTGGREFGHRLGHVGVDDKYGIARGISLQKLRIGSMSLEGLYQKLGSGQLQHDLPKSFSYFDCTDCVENGHGVLTLARPGVENRMGWIKHLDLLLRYLLRPGVRSLAKLGSNDETGPVKYVRRFFRFLLKRFPDVHGGYFNSPFLEQLIYRLVCLGHIDTEAAYGGASPLEAECARHQVKVLLRS